MPKVHNIGYRITIYEYIHYYIYIKKSMRLINYKTGSFSYLDNT